MFAANVQDKASGVKQEILKDVADLLFNSHSCGGVSDGPPPLFADASLFWMDSGQAFTIACPQHCGGTASASACTTRPQEGQW